MLLSPQQRQALLDVARDAIRRHLSDGPGATPGSAATGPLGAAGVVDLSDPVFQQPAGCFVSLHELRTHRLRGCVGRLSADGPLLQSVREAAVNVLSDPRFFDDPVRLDELPRLELEISVLSPLRPAAHPLDFEPLEQGIYLKFGERAGCFLPQVARETGWGREQLLDRLCTEKMGLPAGMWRDPGAKLLVFSSDIIGPEPFVTGSVG